MLIQEEWYNLNSFEFWKQSEGYRQLRQNMEPLIEGIWEPETYVGQT